MQVHQSQHSLVVRCPNQNTNLNTEQVHAAWTTTRLVGWPVVLKMSRQEPAVAHLAIWSWWWSECSLCKSLATARLCWLLAQSRLLDWGELLNYSSYFSLMTPIQVEWESNLFFLLSQATSWSSLSPRFLYSISQACQIIKLLSQIIKLLKLKGTNPLTSGWHSAGSHWKALAMPVSRMSGMCCLSATYLSEQLTEFPNSKLGCRHADTFQFLACKP